MALKPADVKNFETLKKAFAAGHAALMECKDAKTGEYRAVICMVNPQRNGDTDFVPVCHLPTDNPYDAYTPPN